MTSDSFVSLLHEEGASAILRTTDQERAADAMEAALRGGFKVVEFTLTIPGVFELIETFSRRSGLVVGAGTVLSPEDARRAVAAGARFLVSPVVDEAVIAEARSLGVASMPGTHTPTEMYRAHLAGAHLQKVFPAMAGGPAALKACLGPLPFLKLVPTNGVDEHNVAEAFAAGVWAVGFVAPLFAPDDVLQGHTDRIEERATVLLDAVRTARLR